MKYFVIEGVLKSPDLINEDIMKEHIAYTTKTMDAGYILFSGLKSDESGGIFVMKAESLEEVEAYLSAEPLKVNGIQEYRVIEFPPHYFNPLAGEWFKTN